MRLRYGYVYGAKVSPISRPEYSLEFWSVFSIALTIEGNYLRAMFSRIVRSSEKFWRKIATERKPMTCAVYFKNLRIAFGIKRQKPFFESINWIKTLKLVTSYYRNQMISYYFRAIKKALLNNSFQASKQITDQ